MNQDLIVSCWKRFKVNCLKRRLMSIEVNLTEDE